MRSGATRSMGGVGEICTGKTKAKTLKPTQTALLLGLDQAARVHDGRKGLRRNTRSKGCRLYSYLSASIGSSFAALIAGNMPLTIPTKLSMPVDQMRVAASIFR